MPFWKYHYLRYRLQARHPVPLNGAAHRLPAGPVCQLASPAAYEPLESSLPSSSSNGYKNGATFS